MWQAEITKIEADQTKGMFQATIKYSDDERTDEKTDRFSDMEAVKRYAQNGINYLTQIDAVNELVANPPLGVIDFTSPASVEDPNANYDMKRQALIQAKQDADLGLITETEYQTQLADVQTAKFQQVQNVQLK